ncbi:hypothetical protein M3226_02250 [Neobacillus cucumis]|nr:hypothetical protein [Neobacillus cucumis]MCM3724525.1 hypothetical protein [Neobacillus cucumis]
MLLQKLMELEKKEKN